MPRRQPSEASKKAREAYQAERAGEKMDMRAVARILIKSMKDQKEREKRTNCSSPTDS